MPGIMAFHPLLVVGIVASCARAVDVGTCEQFAAVDRKTETEVTITAADFSCDDYTRLSIRTDMVLKSTVGKVTFSNLCLKVYGSLTVEPDVVFNGVDLVEKSGGALRVELGAVGVFQGTAEFNGNSIISTDLGTVPGTIEGSTRPVEIRRKGGAIYNKGRLTFEKDATFTGNQNRGLDLGSGPGGAISLHVKGSMHFMGNLTMSDNSAQNNFGGAEGGAIHNRGDIVVDGVAEFSKNIGGRGGAIYQERWASFVFNDFATFTANKCFDTYGAAVANYGGDMNLEAGSLFFDGFAENSGDGGLGGGIYNYGGGLVTLKSSTTFRHNYGNFGGAIFNQVVSNPFRNIENDPDYDIPVIVFPEDTVFEDNYGQFCNDVAYDLDEETCGV